MRRMAAIQACVALALGFLQAPLLHLHESQHHEHDIAGHHGHSAIVHVHPPHHPALVGKHSEDEFELSHEDHEATQLSVLALKQDPQPRLPFQGITQDAIFPVYSHPIPVERGVVPRGHDPPLLGSSGPRAPPV